MRAATLLVLSALLASSGWMGCSSGGDASTQAAATTGASSTSASTGGGGGSGGGGAASSASTGGGAGGGFVEGPHEPFPDMPNNGGPVLATPTLVTITFAGYAYASEGAALDTYLAGSDWLATVGADYKVGKGTHYGQVSLSQPAPTTADETSVPKLLEPLFQDGTLPAPATLTDAVYILLLPSTTTVSFFGFPFCGPGGLSSGGFHYEGTYQSTKYAFAVINACDDSANAFQDITPTVAHELIEAMTDPFPYTAPGYAIVDPANPWTATLDGEVADMCEIIAPVTEGMYSLPRIWSPTAAAAGSPCIPDPPMPFFDASVSPNKAVFVAAGDSTTFEVQGWSTAPMSDWKLDVYSFGDFDVGGTLGAKTIGNGGTTTLTLSVPKGTPPGKLGLALLYSYVDLDTKFNYWPVVIQSK